MGTVFQARAPGGSAVAIKVLHRATEEAHVRFDRERRLLSALGETEGFVPLVDAGRSPQGPFIVMPFVEGGTLRERLAREGALPLEDAERIARLLARALGRAHRLGIVHRDVKPENV